MCQCANCKREVPEGATILWEGKRLCRDTQACDVAMRPWKDPTLSLEKKNALRIANGLPPVRY